MASVNASFDVIPKVKYPAGDCLIVQDTKPPGIFFLTHGSVDVVIDGSTIAEVSQLGAIFGEMAYFLDSDSSATIRCNTDCEFLFIDNPQEFFRNNPDVIYNITKIMCSRIINLSKQVALLKNNAGEVSGLVDREAMLDKLLKQSGPVEEDDLVVF